MAMLTSLILILAGMDSQQALIHGLTVLAAACPCALALAVPLAHARAAQVAASRGLRIRSPDALDALATVRTTIFDKTGTLTTGQPRLIATDPAPGFATVGQFAFEDTVQPQARQTLDALRGLGIATLMATGDGAGPAGALGRSLGFASGTVHADQTPQDKVRLVNTSPGPVLFVGDGVNEGPALAASGCGVSVANAHAAAAQTADLVVMHGGLEKILTALRLARRTVSIARQNIGLAVIYNALAVPAALAGMLTPTVAAIVMFASSVTVSANALRLRTPRPDAPDALSEYAPQRPQSARIGTR